MTLNPKVFLIGSTLEQAQQIEELIDLYGDDWSQVYKDLITKKTLESTYTKDVKEVCTNNITPCKCRDKHNVCG